MISISEKEQVLLNTKLWLDLFDEFLIVLSVDDEIEEWLDVTLTNSNEVKVESVPGLEHNWSLLWRDPGLFFFGHVNALEGLNYEFGLVCNDNLMLLALSDLCPVLGHLGHFWSVSNIGDESSELDNFWDFVHSVVLHLSELVVLLVEAEPLFVVNINHGSLVWLGTRNLGILGSVLLELHVSLGDLHLLGMVELSEFLHLSGWALLLQLLHVHAKSFELLGLGNGLSLHLELLTMLGALQFHLILFGFCLKSIGVLLESFNFLLLEGHLEHVNGVLEVLNGGGGGDSRQSGELEHF